MNKIKLIKIVISILIIVIIGFSSFIYIKFMLFDLSSNYKEDKYSDLDFENISNIKINLSKAKNINILSGDSIKLDTKSCPLIIKRSSNTLKIKNKNNLSTCKDINIYLNNKETLDNFSLVVKKGDISINNLMTKILNLDSSSGKTILNNILVYDKSSIFTKYGNLSINNSILNNLNLKRVFGNTILSSSILGHSYIEAGMGNLDINLLGNMNDYMISGTRGIGNFLINERRLLDTKIVGNGKNYIKVDGGIGDVTIKFSNKLNTYKMTYKVLNKTNFQEKDAYYLTLQSNNREVDTIIFEDKNSLLDIGKTYEFTFIGNNFDNIRSNFKNIIKSIKEIK